MAIAIDVVSDFVCPWCWIGKRHLDTFAAEADVERRWHPYLLHPDIPASGVDRAEFVRAKFGSDERARELGAGVTAAAKGVGLDIDYSRISRIPDTRDAHRLVRWAGGQGRADVVAEGLFRAYFNEGRDIGEAAVLADIGVAAGMDRAILEELLAGDADREVIDAQADRARSMGVSGVPTHIFANKVAVVGAQPVEALRQAAGLATS
ncbi:DsbA family oxidoreductase [Sphingosinicella soli]|uniref:Putative DsbA family dithiol-disulfide isomerase n=1 Tax=Sphingosinicella soli TaxID=333708 RepID=A0A7W7F7X1_9SPHN|nr:DsbA family oxidoreductase [Sphingosinicella soli]MBB4633124.1 putative DsbA family dithiol-disulfide isomerase [Sphingosinicella soli]